MSKKDQAMKLALEALEDARTFTGAWPTGAKAITAIREALAEQPAQQEPFGYFKAEPFGWTDCAETDEGAIALYERPQPAQQQEPVAHCEAGPEHCPVCLAETRSLALAAAVGYIQRNTPKLVSEEICRALEKISPPASKPEQQEPVAWRVKVETKLRDGSVDVGYQLRNGRLSEYDEPLYTSPPANKPWVGLTLEEIDIEWGLFMSGQGSGYIPDFVHAIEARLKEKNA